MTYYLEDDFIIEADELYREEGTVFTYLYSVDGPVDLTNLGRVEAFGGEAVGVNADSASMVLQNVGSITATGDLRATGVDMGYRESQVINTGLISVRTSGQAEGVSSNSYGARLDNDGKIAAVGNTAFGVRLSSPGAFTNTGTISAQGVEFAYGAYFESASSVIINEGKIQVEADGEAYGLAVNHDNYPPIEGPNVINRGTIVAEVAIVTTDAQYSPSSSVSDWVLNEGKLIGDVLMGGGVDTFENKGSVVGDVHMGSGADIADLRGGKLEGVLYLEDGDDQGKLGGGGQTVSAGLGRDIVSGGRGDDVINGDQGNDVLSGGGGDDEINGGSGSDTLSGGGGDDLIDGFTGDEKITGGAGADTLTGGEGLDSFIYRALSDSTVEASDLITDLSDVDDRINLSRIDGDTTTAGVQGFDIVDAFTGDAGQLVLSYDAGTDITALTVDVDGDGEADMLIRISGDHESFDRFVFGGG